MPADDAFEHALSALLAGASIDDVLRSRSDGPPSLEALRVLSAIGDVSRVVLFGTGQKERTVPTWGHLEIREEIGRGSSGTVYRAWDTRLTREVALKLFDPDNASADAALAEGRLLARFRHPNIVTVYGADTCDGVAGLWMELVQGDPLDQIVQRDGVYGIEDALLAGIDLAGALAAVHTAGMLHRDVKARNVVRQRGGRLVLMDFGAGQGDGERTSPTDGAGTPLYMAPEVLAGGPASAQNDIYGLGVLLHFLVSALYPVMAPDLASLKAAHRSGLRRRLSQGPGDIPLVARTVIDRACAPDPGERYSSARDLELALTEAFRDVLSAHPRVVPRRIRRWRHWRRSLLTAAAASIAACAIVAVSWNTASGRGVRRAMGLGVPPRSPLYFTFGGGIGVLQGSELRLLAAGNQGAFALAASERDGIRTAASAPPWMGDAWFQIDGRPDRAAPGGDGICCLYDGTTDGQFNYALRQDSTLLNPIGSRPLAPPAIYRYDREWREGAPLFELGPSTSAGSAMVYRGITFDGRSQTFWVTRNEPDGTAHAEQWSRGGRRLTTVPVLARATSIAADPADGTLWVLRDGQNESLIRFDNLDASGQPLGSFAVVRPLAGIGIAGMEFVWPAAR